MNNGQRIENIFGTRSNVFHAKYLKPYQKYFTMNTILEKEHLADNIVLSLCGQLENRFVNGQNAGKTADIADWIEYGKKDHDERSTYSEWYWLTAVAAWDLDFEMTFSQDMGFLKTGSDVQNMIHTGEMIMRYLGCVRIPPNLE
jgi:hypothetical protein